MKRVLAVVGGVLWFALVFFVTWRMTFPSEAVGNRIKVEVHKATNGAFELSMADLAPWWVGAKANSVVLYEVGRAEKTPDFAFEAARVRAGLLSLIRNEPRVMGAVQIGSSDLDYDVTVAMNKRGTGFVPRTVALTAERFPLQDIAGLAGATIEASGGLDLDVDLSAEDGMREAKGAIKISGRDLLISKLDPELTGGMDLGMEIPIDEVDIRFDVDQGKAELRDGKIKSSLVDAKLEGDITLREDMGRSTLNIEIALELGDELAMFKGFIKRAEWSDGSFHYKCSGTFDRPSCRENPERGASAARGRGRSRGEDDEARPRTRTESQPRSSLSDEERDKRRQEALERLREARERRGEGGDEATDASGNPGDGELEEIGYEDDDEFDEELPDGEDLGVEELVPDDAYIEP